jgi:cytochrome c oxidase subunit 4
MANDPNDRYRLPGVGERIRRLAENPVPSGGIPPRGGHTSPYFNIDVPEDAQMAHAGGPHGHGGAHGTHDAHHPTARTYIIVGIVLTVITAVEVSAYYIPAWEGSAIYVPSMLFLSAIKFATVAMVYMHLKYDHKLFRVLFTGPFLIAFLTLFGLMFLFGKLAIRLGVLA